MKAKPDQLAGSRPAAGSPGQLHPASPAGFPVDPPIKRESWFSSYDEEWSAFLAEKSIHKNRPGINHDDTDAQPRVWNMPPG